MRDRKIDQAFGYKLTVDNIIELKELVSSTEYEAKKIDVLLGNFLVLVNPFHQRNLFYGKELIPNIEDEIFKLYLENPLVSLEKEEIRGFVKSQKGRYEEMYGGNRFIGFSGGPLGEAAAHCGVEYRSKTRATRRMKRISKPLVWYVKCRNYYHEKLKRQIRFVCRHGVKDREAVEAANKAYGNFLYFLAMVNWKLKVRGQLKAVFAHYLTKTAGLSQRQVAETKKSLYKHMNRSSVRSWGRRCKKFENNLWFWPNFHRSTLL